MERALNAVPAFPPDHPGSILREEFLIPAGFAVKVAAERLDVSRQTLHRVLSGQSAVTADMALRLGRFTGTSPVFWLNLQAQHDLWHQGRALARVLRGIHPLGADTERTPKRSEPASERIRGAKRRGPQRGG